MRTDITEKPSKGAVPNLMDKDSLFENICHELQSHPLLGTYYKDEKHLKDAVLRVIEKYDSANNLPLTARDTNLEGIKAFGRGKTPDIAIKFREERFIAIEVKYRNTSDWVLSRGIGQAVTYSVKYPYGIIFIRDSFDKDPSVSHDFDDEIKSSLMRNYRIKLIIRYNYGP